MLDSLSIADEDLVATVHLGREIESGKVSTIWWALRELRILYFAAMALPITLGAAIAWSRAGRFDFGLFVLTLVGGIFVQAGTNMANDFFDYQAEEHELTAHLLPPQQALQGALAFFIVGIMIGLYLAVLAGPLVIGLGVVAVISGYVYSAPPLRLSGTGLGELLGGLNMGMLTTIGSYYVQTGVVVWEPVLASLPVGLLMAALLALHGFQGEKLAQTVGRSLWAWFGPQAAPAVYGVPALVAFGVLLVQPLQGGLLLTVLLALLAAPLALVAVVAAGHGQLQGAMRNAMAAHLGTVSLLVVAYLLAGLLQLRG
jgi:1,4-dihydroxy-2-naphthoate octaprenyltransferase